MAPDSQQEMTIRRVRNSTTKHYWIMLIPAAVWLILFQAVPIYGIVMAFQDYNAGDGFFGSPFVGFENFARMLIVRDVSQVLMNSLVIAFGKIVFNIIVPLVFALMLNELRRRYLVRFIQTSVYLPYFLSWVILSGIMLQLFSQMGPINKIIEWVGGEHVMFFQNPDTFRTFIIGSDVWKNFGFNSIIYLAALTGIDQSLYEAASADGAGRLRQLWHVTLPGIRTTILLLAILSLGGILEAGFDQVYNLYNPLVYSTGDIIDTYVYRSGLQELDFSFATAVGLLKSVVSAVLITVGYWVARRFVGYRIF